MVPRQRATCRTPRLVCFGWIFLVGVRAVRVGEMRPARHWVAYSLLAERSVRVHLSRTCPLMPGNRRQRWLRVGLPHEQSDVRMCGRARPKSETDCTASMSHNLGVGHWAASCSRLCASLRALATAARPGGQVHEKAIWMTRHNSFARVRSSNEEHSIVLG